MSTDQPTDPHAPEQAHPVEAATAPAADAQAHAPEAPHEQTVSAAEQELSDMKLVVLESAELANRSANMATHAGAELKGATKDLVHTLLGHKKFHTLMISITGAFLVLGAVIFGTMTFTLKARISQMDEMLSAMSSRVGELNQGLEVVGSVNEGFQEMVGKQADMVSAQNRLEVRLNEYIQSAQAEPQEKAKQAEAREQAMAKQIQALDGGLKSQSQAINSMSAQMQSLNRALSETANLKREMESLAKLQRERQAAEAQQLAQANKPKPAPTPQVERPKERMVRYPRAEMDTSPTPGAGVLSTQ